MIFRCDCDDCKYWELNAGDLIDEGGCTMDEVIIEMQLTASGLHPMCRNYKEEENEKD